MSSLSDTIKYGVGDINNFVEKPLPAHPHSLTDVVGAAPINSPTFTGVVNAPTPESGTNNIQVATTAFVQAAISGLVPNIPDIPSNIFQFVGTWNNTTAYSIGNTVFGSDNLLYVALQQITGGQDPSTGAAGWHRLSQSPIDLSSYALLNSPTFTGTPTAPTPDTNNNSTRIATTAYVNEMITSNTPVPPDLSGLAPIDSPTFTGNPKAPTPSLSASGNEIATASFVRSLMTAPQNSDVIYTTVTDPVTNAQCTLVNNFGRLVFIFHQTSYSGSQAMNFEIPSDFQPVFTGAYAIYTTPTNTTPVTFTLSSNLLTTPVFSSSGWNNALSWYSRNLNSLNIPIVGYSTEV